MTRYSIQLTESTFPLTIKVIKVIPNRYYKKLCYYSIVSQHKSRIILIQETESGAMQVHNFMIVIFFYHA